MMRDLKCSKFSKGVVLTKFLEEGIYQEKNSMKHTRAAIVVLGPLTIRSSLHIIILSHHKTPISYL